MTTLKDVAKAAGVNTSTVSKALRGSSDLNPETAQRVRDTAARLDYRVRERKNGAKRTVGIICPELMGSYYARIASTLTALLRKRDLDVLLSVSGFESEREQTLLQEFVRRGMSGIICVTENDLRKSLRSVPAEIPAVVVAANYPLEDRDVIMVDERIGMRRLAEHLTELGHRKIAFAGTQYAGKRLEYLTQELAALGAALDSERIVLTQSRHAQCGYEAADRILSHLPLPTAVVAEYDDVALGLMRRFSECGIRVPDDISVTGFDDADFCAYLPVSLTSVDTHAQDLCEIAADTLIRKMDDPAYQIAQSIRVQPTLRIGESTGKVSKQ